MLELDRQMMEISQIQKFMIILPVGFERVHRREEVNSSFLVKDALNNIKIQGFGVELTVKTHQPYFV
jgi:hypothetical protein